LWGGTQKAITETITNGRSSQMPAWGHFLDKDKLHIMTAYVWGMSNKDGKKAPAKKAEPVQAAPAAEASAPAADSAASAAPASDAKAAPAAEAAAPAAPAVTQSVARANRPVYSSSASSYPVGQCTWGAKTLAPWAGDYWGNGGQWSASAAAAGFRVGSQPEVGAIACWTDGGYGHVAVVTAVQSTTSIQVSEANYLGQQSIGNYRGWFNPTTAQGTVSYIYPN